MNNEISRREMLKAVGMAIAGSMIGLNYSCFSPQKSEDVQRGKNFLSKPFRICLNTSTIRAYSLPVDEQVKLCAEAGFDGIELWVSEVDAYIEKGGDYATLRKIIDDSNLKLENMIAFSTWAADDPIKREEGIKTMRHNMEVSASLGSQFVAAPVQGVDKFIPEMIPEYSNRFLRILEMGEEYGVTPLLELWGAGVINTLDKATAMAMGTGHPKASLLLDFYHIYRGGGSFESLNLLNGAMLPVFHINDYPSSIHVTELRDSDRIFPGDGVCPFQSVIPKLREQGFKGALSIEIFNKGYWEQMDVREILKTSYQKVKAVIDHSITV